MMTTIKATNNVVDGHGRVLYRRGSTYAVDDAEASRLIQAGYARPCDADFDTAIETLRGGGIVGVVVGPHAAPKLLAAVEAGGLTVHDDLEVEHEADPGAAPPPAPTDSAAGAAAPAAKPKRRRRG